MASSHEPTPVQLQMMRELWQNYEITERFMTWSQGVMQAEFEKVKKEIADEYGNVDWPKDNKPLNLASARQEQAEELHDLMIKRFFQFMDDILGVGAVHHD